MIKEDRKTKYNQRNMQIKKKGELETHNLRVDL